MIKLNEQLLKFNYFLILLLPISFVVGPLIVEIISAILVLQLLYFSFKKKNFFYIKNKIFIFFISFYIFLLITLFFSEYFQDIYINVIFYFRFVLFTFAIYFFLISNSKILKKIYICLLLTILIVIFDGFWQYFFDENLLGYEKYRIDRISGFFKDDLVLGSFLSRLIPLHIGLTFFFKNDKKLTFVNSLIIFLL
jgi:O-antigen ligase